jgi:hypothetical protein
VASSDGEIPALLWLSASGFAAGAVACLLWAQRRLETLDDLLQQLDERDVHAD